MISKGLTKAELLNTKFFTLSAIPTQEQIKTCIAFGTMFKLALRKKHMVLLVLDASGCERARVVRKLKEDDETLEELELILEEEPIDLYLEEDET
jgi:hypothetical protein